MREEVSWFDFVVLLSVYWFLSVIFDVPIVRSLYVFIVHDIIAFIVFFWVKILSGNLWLRISILSSAIRRDLLVVSDVSGVLRHWGWNWVLRYIIVLIVIKLREFYFLVIVRIWIFVTLLALKGITYLTRRVRLVALTSVLLDLPDRLSKWLEWVIMFILYLLDLFVKGIVLRNDTG